MSTDNGGFGGGHGTFDLPAVVLKCDGTEAALDADRVLLANSGSSTSTSILGGVTPASRMLWSFPNDGNGCPTEVIAPNAATRCTDVNITSADFYLGALPDGTVGWVRPSRADAPVFRTVAGGTTLNPLNEQGIFITAAGTVTLATPAAGNLCASTRVFVKRTSNDPTVVVRVTAPAGIDGAPGNTIQLGTSSSFGALTGEGAVFVYDGATWHIISAY